MFDSVTSVFVFERAELIRCRFLPIIIDGDFILLILVEFGLSCQNEGTFLGKLFFVKG